MHFLDQLNKFIVCEKLAAGRLGWRSADEGMFGEVGVDYLEGDFAIFAPNLALVVFHSVRGEVRHCVVDEDVTVPMLALSSQIQNAYGPAW